MCAFSPVNNNRINETKVAVFLRLRLILSSDRRQREDMAGTRFPEKGRGGGGRLALQLRVPVHQLLVLQSLVLLLRAIREQLSLPLLALHKALGLFPAGLLLVIASVLPQRQLSLSFDSLQLFFACGDQVMPQLPMNSQRAFST